MKKMKDQSLGFLISLLMFSCHPKDASDSRLHHDAGRFLNSENPHQWYVINDAQYQKLNSSEQIYSANHPLTVHLQSWADAIRQNMLLSTPQLEVTPRPIIRIVKNDLANAHVNPVDVCAKIAINRNNVSPTAQNPSYLINNNYVTGASYPPSDCLAFSGDVIAARDFVQWGLRNIKDCKVSILDQQLTLSQNCDSPMKEWSSFAGFVTKATHNYVTVNSKLIETMNEDEVVGALAHELGHYYMGHPTVDPKQYYYFYRLDGKNPGTKPQALSYDDPLFAVANQIQSAPPKLFSFPQVPSQKFPSFMYTVAQILSKKISNQVQTQNYCQPNHLDCLVTCKDFDHHMKNGYPALEEFPDDFSGTDAEKQSYSQYEDEVQACFNGIIGSSFQADLETEMQPFIKYKQAVGALKAADGESLLSLFIRASLIFTDTRNEVNSLVQEGAAKGLGWYTDEQEADDISSEMVARLGLQPIAAVTAMISLIARPDLAAQCRIQFDRGFPDLPSIGDYVDPHHADCFRARNIFTELTTHSDYYSRFKQERPVVLPAGLSWEALQASLHQEL